MTLRIGVGPDRRHFVDTQGRPWFYLADTAWQLFQSLDLSEARHYLDVRQAQGFTAIQAAAYPEFGGLDAPNRQGDLAMHDGDPGRPHEGYFDHVAAVVDLAAERGLVIVLLPTWGCHVTRAWATGPTAEFDTRTAEAYGRWLGRRLGDRANVIWCLGGDREVPDAATRAIWDALARGLRAEERLPHLMAFHPRGGSSSSQWVDDAPWLDVRMLQSGHLRRASRNWAMVLDDADRRPTRPVVDAEPCYENHPIWFDPTNGWFDALDVRCAAWWAVLSGAAGHTYGCHDVWMMASDDFRPVASARGHWRTSLTLPGAQQMRHVRSLLSRRLWPGHFSANALALSRTQDTDHVAVARDGRPGCADASVIVAYTPVRGQHLALDTACLRGPRRRWWWWDPRCGVAYPGDEEPNVGPVRPRFPDGGPDWVLVVDDADQHEPWQAPAHAER